MVTKPIVMTPRANAVAKQVAASNPTQGEGSDAGTGRSVDRHQASSTQKWHKLAALAARLATLPKNAQSFSHIKPPRAVSTPLSWGLQVAFSEVPFIQTSGNSRRQSAGFSTTALGEKIAGGEGDIEEYDDFGDWVGDVLDSSVGNPGSFLAKFKKADGGEFDENALRVYGCTQKIENGLAELQNASKEQLQYRSKLNALASVCVDLLKLICDIPSAAQNLPAISEVKDSYLTQLDALFKSSGDRDGRQHYLREIEQTYTAAGANSALDSVPGRMLAHLSASIQRELKNVSNHSDELPATGVSMRASLMPILAHFQTMHERQAGLESLAGNHSQATTLLQKCESIIASKRILDPSNPSSDHVALYFNLLKSQILAKDSEAVGTLETLYMTMREYAEDHENRFGETFAQAVFVRDLEDAYSTFLEELENGGVTASLEHPIAQLFVHAQEHGVFDDLKLD